MSTAWRTEVEALASGDVAVVDGVAVVATSQGLVGLDPASGEPVRTHELGLDTGQPVTAYDGGLLLVDDDGGVRRLDL